jgi:hypothetical protein
MSTLETITSIDLSNVTGGATQKQMVCNRSQFDWMAAHMVPEGIGHGGGVVRRVVQHDARLCGFPMPK